MSERYFCGNCWTVSARDDLSYRCTACGDPSLPGWIRGTGSLRSVRDLLPPWYWRWLSEDREIACPSHPGARLQLFCPVCTLPLSEASRVRRGDPLALGIAGPRTAGKTLFTATLVRELRRRQVGGRPLGLIGLDDTEERFSAIESSLLEGRKPDATAEEPDLGLTSPSPRNFCWQVQSAGPDRRGAAPAFLTIYDVAGETWGLPSSEALARFDRYVGALSSLVFLIDGAAVAHDLGFEVEDAWDPAPGTGIEDWVDRQWLSRVRDRLGRRSRKVDLALVVSKADYLWDHEDWKALRPEGEKKEREEALRRLLDRSGRSSMWTEGHQSFNRIGLFAVSSLGFRPGPDDVERDNGASKLVREVSPVGVTDPVVWLLGRRLPALREEDLP